MNTAKDYIDCYLSGQIPESDWTKILAENKNVSKLYKIYENKRR